MNARTIKIVIILISVALAGSVFVQVYWSFELIKNSKIDFDTRVNKALYEATFRYKAYVFNNDKDVVKYKDEFSSYVDSLKAKANIETIKSIPIIIEEDGMGESSLKKRYNSLINSNADKSIYKGYQSYEIVEGDEFFKMDSTGLKEQMLNDLSDLLISTLTKKQAVIDTLILDSIVKVSLRMNGVDIPYEIGVFNTYLNRFVYSSNNESSILKKSIYETVLYNLENNDDEQIILRLGFSNSRFYIMQRILFMLGLLIVFSIVIIGAFYTTVSMIYNQKRISEIKSELIANISHELKTPISIISLAVQSMEDPDVMKKESCKGYLKMISDENKRFSLLVENILLSSILDSGKVPMKIETIDVNLVLEQVVSGFSLMAEASGVSLELHKNAKLFSVEGDAIMIMNLYSSIIENAIKYSDKGVEKSIVKITTSNLKDKYLKVDIEDNGIGIAKDDVKRVFDKLFRVPSKNIHNVKGHGLGLSYAKSIAQKHNGDITVKSQLGVGTIFTIILPLEQSITN